MPCSVVSNDLVLILKFSEYKLYDVICLIECIQIGVGTKVSHHAIRGLIQNKLKMENASNATQGSQWRDMPPDQVYTIPKCYLI